MSKISSKNVQAEAAEGFIAGIRKDSLMFAPQLLKSALFKASKGPRLVHAHEVEIPTHIASVKMYFTGEELQQDDLRVLLMLMKMREGSLATRMLQFSPREFCVAMGRADSSSSVKVVRDSLIRLQRANVRVTTLSGGRYYYSFVSSVEFERGRWRVCLSERVAQMLADNPPSFFEKSFRFEAKDGLESWLLGFVAADECKVSFKLEAMQKWTGLTGYALKEFTRLLKKELTGLAKLGMVDSFSFKEGKVSIVKSAKALEGSDES